MNQALTSLCTKPEFYRIIPYKSYTYLIVTLVDKAKPDKAKRSEAVTASRGNPSRRAKPCEGAVARKDKVVQCPGTTWKAPRADTGIEDGYPGKVPRTTQACPGQQ